ncbi:MAG: hypothetical protein JKY49_08375 [Cohaesibacteraceae bacterium]|nr:hypothetical protein [Cohaesibacteraceae bacterium]MBL4876580.1 hypothetical protein [Cohaesibacteraceae bacterium]
MVQKITGTARVIAVRKIHAGPSIRFGNGSATSSTFTFFAWHPVMVL